MSFKKKIGEVGSESKDKNHENVLTNSFDVIKSEIISEATNETANMDIVAEKKIDNENEDKLNVNVSKNDDDINNNKNINKSIKKSNKVKKAKYNKADDKTENHISSVLKTVVLGLTTLILIVILLVLLLNLNNKYKYANNSFLKSLFAPIEKNLKNVFYFERIDSNKLDVNIDKNETKLEVSDDKKSSDKYSQNKQINERTDIDIINESQNNEKKDFNKNGDEIVSSETIKIEKKDKEIEDFKTKKSNNYSDIKKIDKKAIKISPTIKKLRNVNATWKYNKTKNVWNLVLDKKGTLAKDAVYIIDYNSPINNEPCSSTYYFDKKGNLVLGWGEDIDGYYYYFNDDKYDIGKMCTGWKKIEDKEYYFLPNGKLLTDSLTPDGYYVDINGEKK